MHKLPRAPELCLEPKFPRQLKLIWNNGSCPDQKWGGGRGVWDGKPRFSLSVCVTKLLRNIRTAGPQYPLEPLEPRGGGRGRHYRTKKSLIPEAVMDSVGHTHLLSHRSAVCCFRGWSLTFGTPGTKYNSTSPRVPTHINPTWRPQCPLEVDTNTKRTQGSG